LTAFQSQEVSQQAQSTNYAQRFSAPPVRPQAYVPGFSAAPIAPVSTGTSLDQLDSMTNDRLWYIAGGNGMGILSTPSARMRARQILRARGVNTAATNPAASRPSEPVSSPTLGTALDQLDSMTSDRLIRIASGQGPGIFATPGARMRSRQILRSRGVDAQPTNPAARDYDGPVSSGAPRVPLFRQGGPLQAPETRARASLPMTLVSPPVPMNQAPKVSSVPFARRAAVAPSLPTSTVPAAVQAAISPKGPIAMRASIRPMGPSGFSMSARLSPGARSAASANMGFDTYGLEPGAVAPIVPDGYSVVPDFTTLSLSAIKEHPLKTIASVAGLFAAGALLAKPVGNLIRSRIG
jgi:hypothetical protein